MERKLKFHEQKLLKKHTNFVGTWKKENTLHENEIIRRYYLQDRSDYYKYNQVCNMLKKLAAALSKLDSRDPFRIKMTEQLLEKLYSMGLITTKKSLVQVTNLTVSAFCRRRLAVLLVKNKYAETMKAAVTYVETEQIRVGPNIITDPAFLVTRNMEDFITWTDTSKVKKNIMTYHNKMDDFDFLD
eukprot:TRINITY_DN6739_c0_g1_i1.p1 TRINITY_DN6739_c0_g1~~TRINITY_DN6739_c0_g1_i1.p1  ORF type:complete len:186 (+),score=40.83 TRINITY_DN6739_c0_g1_i1:251-808(+)